MNVQTCSRMSLGRKRKRDMGSGRHQIYLEELIKYLEETNIYDLEGIAYKNWEEGMQAVTGLFLETRQKGKQLFFIGNGGSAAIASHMAADYMKNGRMKTISLYDSAVVTCFGNDYGYEQVFSRSLERLGEDGDLLIAISSSGNSPNIVNAIQMAKEKGLHVVTLSGFEGTNRIRAMGDYNIYVPVCHYGMVESIHNLILQQIVDALMEYTPSADRMPRL